MGFSAQKDTNSLYSKYKIIEQPIVWKGAWWEPFWEQGVEMRLFSTLNNYISKTSPVRGTLPCPWGGNETWRAIQFSPALKFGCKYSLLEKLFGRNSSFLLSHFLHPNKAAIHKEICKEDENERGRSRRLGEQRKWLFLRGRECDCSGNNYTCYLINSVSSIYYVARTCLVSVRK